MLTDLNLSYNHITSVDLSHQTKLTHLDLLHNPLITVSENCYQHFTTEEIVQFKRNKYLIEHMKYCINYIRAMRIFHKYYLPRLYDVTKNPGKRIANELAAEVGIYPLLSSTN